MKKDILIEKIKKQEMLIQQKNYVQQRINEIENELNS
jgi:hypothetical protein